MKLIKELGIVFIILKGCVLSAQPSIQVQKYSINDGLSHTRVERFLHDKEGFVWISTWNGLNKFDGYNFKNYKSHNDENSILTDNRIVEIFENHYGNIWCITYSGKVFLFDSKKEIFNNIFINSNKKIHDDYIATNVVCLSKGVSWIVLKKGGLIRVLESDDVKSYELEFYNSQDSRAQYSKVYTINTDTDNDEWVLTDKGPFIVGGKSVNSDIPFKWITETSDKRIYLASPDGEFSEYIKSNGSLIPVSTNFSHNKIHSLSRLKKSRLGIGTDNGLLVFDEKKERFQHFNVNTNGHNTNKVLSIYEDQHGELWLFTDKSGITRLNPVSGEIQHLLHPDNKVETVPRGTVSFVQEDSIGNIWMIPRNGNFCYFDREVEKLKYVFTNPLDPESIFLPEIWSYFTDRRGFIWYYPFNYGGIINISFLPDNYDFTSMCQGKKVRAMVFDDHNNIWTGAWRGGVSVYTNQEKLLGHLWEDGSLRKEKGDFNLNPYYIFEDSKKNIWIGTKYNGIYRLKRKVESKYQYNIEQFTHSESEKYSISNNNVFSIFEDSNNRLWIGSYNGGLNLISEDDNGNTIFINKNNELKNYPNELCLNVRFITEVNNSILMVATTDGLLTFSSEFKEPQNIKIYHNVKKSGLSATLSDNDIMHIYQDSRKDIYLCTASGGICEVISSYLLSDSVKFRTFSTKDGMATDVTISMFEDEKDMLWIVSENSITKYNPNNRSFKNYIRPAYLENLIFTEALPLKNNHQVLLGTETGVIKVNPHDMQNENYVPNVSFTTIKTQNAGKQRILNNDDKIIINPDERNLHFQYVAFDYINPEGIRYAYRMNGLEYDWNFVDNNRSASYINIPKGKYTFQVKSTNSEGIWTNNIKSIQVVVKPKFWETKWAWVLYLIVFIFIIFVTVKIVLHIFKLKNDVKIEKQLAQIKLQFFTDISHELRTPLTLISNPVTEVLENENLSDQARNHLKLVQSNTNRMTKLVNQVLDFRKIQNNKMNIVIERFNIAIFIQNIATDFQLLAKEKNITFKIDNQVENLFIYSDKDKVEKILLNLLSNAFKYTPKGKRITILFKQENSQFLFSVIDEGIGINQSKLGNIFQRFETILNYDITKSSTGIGLSLVKEIVELLKGKIDLKSKEGKGSEFTVSLPIECTQYNNQELVEYILEDGTEFKSNNLVYKEEENREERITIHIVEDNHELRQFMKNLLSSEYHILDSSNGEEGLEKTKQEIPDLIISDVMMPVMDGLDMVKKIKEDKDIRHIPIILLSAKGSLDDRIKGLEYGIDEYLPKPFNTKYLKIKIQNLIEQRKILKDYYIEAFSNKNDANKLFSLEIDPSASRNADNKFIQDIMAYVKENIENGELKIEDIAQKLSLSRTVFYRKFKSIFGSSPIEFLVELRIKTAVQYIEKSNLTFAEIAYKTGFNEPQYFSKSFKKYMGMSPSAYRKKLKEDEN